MVTRQRIVIAYIIAYILSCYSMIFFDSGDVSRIATVGELAKFMVGRDGPWTLVVCIIVAAFCKSAFWGWQLTDVFFLSLVIMLRGCIEWVVHAYIMHAYPLPIVKLRIKTMVYDMHMNHHKNPNNLNGVLFRGRSVLASLIIVSFVFLFIGVNFTILAVIALSSCFLMYEIFHILSHSSINLEGSFLKMIVSSHRYHHSVNGRVCFGVSSALGDRIMGTRRGGP